jgi:agmatinase
MGENVFITFDLDALDPSIMPSTGTPEPGGLFWYETLEFLRQVFEEKNVVGFDLVELCPNPHNPSSDFLAAKLYYKMLSYKFMDEEATDEYDNTYDESQLSAGNTNKKFADDDA